MNKERRNRLDKIRETIEQCIADLQEIEQEEQEAFDNLPESLQESERGMTMEANIEEIADISGDLENLTMSIQDIIDK